MVENLRKLVESFVYCQKLLWENRYNSHKAKCSHWMQALVLSLHSGPSVQLFDGTCAAMCIFWAIGIDFIYSIIFVSDVSKQVHEYYEVDKEKQAAVMAL